MHGRIGGLSSDRLMHILLQLDQEVVIFIRLKPEDRPAVVTVDMAHRL